MGYPNQNWYTTTTNPRNMSETQYYSPRLSSVSMTNFIWVQGEEGAKAYPIAPGNSVLMMDSEDPVIYIKSADPNGRPLPMEVYDLVKRENTPAKAVEPQIDMSMYMKRDEVERLIDEKTKDFMKRNHNKKKGESK